jgi:hypothetical protein
MLPAIGMLDRRHGPRCQVCVAPKAVQDRAMQAMALGAGRRLVGRAFGLSPDACRRHFMGHLTQVEREDYRASGPVSVPAFNSTVKRALERFPDAAAAVLAALTAPDEERPA